MSAHHICPSRLSVTSVCHVCFSHLSVMTVHHICLLAYSFLPLFPPVFSKGRRATVVDLLARDICINSFFPLLPPPSQRGPRYICLRMRR